MKFKKGHTPWNKGKKCFKHSGSFKKGHSNTYGFKKGHPSYLTPESIKKMSLSRSGKNNHNWKGGRYKDKDGYILILKSNHPYCNKGGYILKHRVVMEKHLGRYLKPKEVVHHINNIRDDNRIKNLKLFKDCWEHILFHKDKKLIINLLTSNQKL